MPNGDKNISDSSNNKNDQKDNKKNLNLLNNNNNNQALTIEELRDIIITLNNKIFELELKNKEEVQASEERQKQKINKLEETQKQHKKEIEALKKNQLLLYHQINMYKTWRDISKSINYYK